MSEEKKNGWGGRRAGAGRPKGTTRGEGIVRAGRAMRAFDDEWEMIKEFAAVVKKDPAKARAALDALKSE